MQRTSRRGFLKLAGLGAAGATLAAAYGKAAAAATSAPGRPKPNIIFILADDIGYGDFGCYGATKVKTPNVDRFAAGGLRFTDAHSSSAVCTPSRYSLMTGEYAWRKPGTGILRGIDGLIIEPGRLTVPALLRRAGYATGVVGKWHLGLGTTPTDFNTEVKPGPLEVGFDYAWILPATGDRVPCVWVENHRVAGLDPADPIRLDYTIPRGHAESFVNGIPRIGKQTGGKAALWNDEEMSTVIAAKGCAFIERNQNRPFFLYLATHNIHVPRVPHPRFRGTSQCGVRGDTIQEFDWTVGQVFETLERLKLAENTLVIVSSDNGGVLDANGPDIVHGGTRETNNGHLFNGVLRGTKGTIYEGGNRVPFIARWPGRTKSGVSDQLLCHVDLLASFAALTGQALGPADGPDSYNVLPALLGENRSQPCRDYLVEHAGPVLALRKGTWKLISGTGKGKRKGKGNKRPETENRSETVAKSDYPPAGGELYNLADDLGETKNVAAAQPELAREMSAMLEQLRAKGRSRP